MLTAQSFRQLPLEEQLDKTTNDFSNWEIWNYENLQIKNEDLSGNIKTTKLKELSMAHNSTFAQTVFAPA